MNHRFRLWATLPFLLGVLLLAGSAAPAQSLQEQIDQIFARPQLSVNVWTGYATNEAGTLVHYTHQPDTGRIPASNAKITTTAAAWELLGPNYSFESRVYANGTITGGVLNGDLNLVVEHDPTWSTRYFSNARTPLNHIATRVRTVAGITSVTGTVRVYGSTAYNHTSTGNLSGQSTTSHNTTSASAFRDALIANGVSVAGGSSGHTGFSPPGTLVYTHQSSDVGNYTLELLIRPLNKVSINPSSDLILRHIGYKLNGNDPASDTYAAGRVHVEAWMASKPFDSTGFAQADGSGLSRNNRQSARMMVALFRYMHENHPAFEPSYTIACTDGTLASRLCGADTTGRVHGKTGSLRDTISLSGYVRNRHTGERVYFSFIHNHNIIGNNIDQPATRAAIDDAIRLLAGADVPTHNPPATPELVNLRVAGLQSAFLLQWTAPPGAATYAIHRSINGSPFVFVREINAPTLSTIEPVTGTAIHAYRITARNEDGESVPSDVLAGRINTPGPRILLVRGTDEPSPDSSTPMPGGMLALSKALPADIAFETASAQRIGTGLVDLSRFEALLWFFEHDDPDSHTFSEGERAVVADHLAAGGSLLVSGSKLATNMDPAFGGDAASGEFLHTVLHHQAQMPSAGVNFVNSQQTVIFGGIIPSSVAGCDTSTYSNDVIEPLGPARTELLYQPGSVGPAAISVEDGCRLVVFVPSFSCVAIEERAEEYMERIMSFLIPPPAGEVTDFFALH